MRLSIALVFALIATPLAAAADQPARKPNVIVIAAEAAKLLQGALDQFANARPANLK
jgi:hypothetical protein